jgi:hypothetical protein
MLLLCFNPIFFFAPQYYSNNDRPFWYNYPAVSPGFQSAELIFPIIPGGLRIVKYRLDFFDGEILTLWYAHRKGNVINQKELEQCPQY